MQGPAPSSPAKHFIGVGSGKGGVGKSTVTINLALALSQMGHKVGVIDADVYGPNIPLMVNITRRKPARFLTLAWKGEDQRWDPVEKHGIKIMSVGFLTGEEQAIWEPNLVNAISSQLVERVRWGELDYLIADLPPGSADINRTFATSMPMTDAILVVTPQDVAHLDAKKALEMYRMAGVRVLGAVENMSGLVCPHCAESIDVFHRVADDRSLWSLGVRKLGVIPLDPQLSVATDGGRPVMVSGNGSSHADAFRQIATTVAGSLGTAPRPI